MWTYLFVLRRHAFLRALPVVRSFSWLTPAPFRCHSESLLVPEATCSSAHNLPTASSRVSYEVALCLQLPVSFLLPDSVTFPGLDLLLDLTKLKCHA